MACTYDIKHSKTYYFPPFEKWFPTANSKGSSYEEFCSNDTLDLYKIKYIDFGTYKGGDFVPMLSAYGRLQGGLIKYKNLFIYNGMFDLSQYIFPRLDIKTRTGNYIVVTETIEIMLYLLDKNIQAVSILGKEFSCPQRNYCSIFKKCYIISNEANEDLLNNHRLPTFIEGKILKENSIEEFKNIEDWLRGKIN